MIIETGSNSINATDSSGQNALHFAAQNPAPELVQLLYDNGCAPNDRENYTSPLHIACEKGFHEVVEVILKQREIDETILIDIKREDGFTALMLAAMKGHLKIVKMLIGAGVDRSIEREWNVTAFYLAVKYNHTEIS